MYYLRGDSLKFNLYVPAPGHVFKVEIEFSVVLTVQFEGSFLHTAVIRSLPIIVDVQIKQAVKLYQEIDPFAPGAGE